MHLCVSISGIHSQMAKIEALFKYDCLIINNRGNVYIHKLHRK